MCGRFRVPGEKQLLKAFEGYRVGDVDLPERFNVAPTQPIPAARRRGDVSELVLLRWQLIPWFAKGIPPKYSTINARVETIETAASYKGPWKNGQRCILPALGFYEWQVLDGQKQKQPWYIHVADQEVFGFAGLWERSRADDGTVVGSATMIVMPSNKLLSHIHNSKERMPAILRREDWDAWLGGTQDEAHTCLKQYPDESMLAWPVSLKVNSVKNEGPELIDPADVRPGSA